jgi:hypothetical protein
LAEIGFCVPSALLYDSDENLFPFLMDKFRKVFVAVLIGLSIAGWFHFTTGWSIWLQIAGTVVIVVVFSSVSDFLAK